MARFAPLALVACLIAGPAAAAGPGGECYCRDGHGGRAELGDVICLNVNGRAFLAQCQMASNVTAWKDLKRPCVSSLLDRFELGQPVVELACIDPAVAAPIDQM
jgi:hypothetical protein